MSPEEGRSAIRETVADLHDGGMDMGSISCLVLDELISYFTGINMIRRVIDGQE